MDQSKLIKKKICLLGAFSVGKTSLIQRYVYNRFDERYLSTLGVKISQKILEPVHKNKVQIIQYNLLIWDIEGYDPETPAIRNYYKGAAAAILVADISNPTSIALLDTILNNFHSVAPEAAVILSGNKCDLPEDNAAQIESLEKYAAKRSFPLLLTSAKTGENVERLFYNLSEIL